MKSMNRFATSPRRHPRHQTAGFTLIEVLVTLGLTMIMMLLFAVIFQKTGDFVTRQKGIGENDQSARILTTVLKTDLEARSMRFLAPFHPGMPALGDDNQNRLGYFYVSENNPMDDTDDVLQFTTYMGAANFMTTANPARGTQVSGLATNLPLPWQATTAYAAGAYVRPTGAPGASPPTGFIYKNNGAAFTSGGTEPNWSTGPYTDGGGTWTPVVSAIDQPDGDDAVMSYLTPSGVETVNPPNVSPNSTGQSQYAEVTYFLRHGNLYRRVLLIRTPYNYGINSPVTATSQPYAQDVANTYLIPGAYPPTGFANTFWGDFDYAARINAGASPGVQFLASAAPESSLMNLTPGSYPIGRPDNRFGFDQVYPNPMPPAGTQTTNGAPREYAFPYNSTTNTIIGGATPTPVFFGRYTHEETSNLNFLFPGALPLVGGTATSPMGYASVLGLDSTSYTMWLLNANPPTAQLSFAGGARRGEDILLTNVISFDVKLWDAHYSEAAGNDVNRNGIIDAGPAFADVGHTAATGDFLQSKNAFPVYGPNIPTGGYTVPPMGSNSWAPAETYTSNGVTYNNNNVFDTWFRFFDFDNLVRYYDSNDTASVNAPAPYRPRLGVQWQPGTAYTLGQQVDPVNTANGYVYKCTTAGTSAAAPANQPDPFSLTDSVSPPVTVTDGTVQWTPQAPLAVQAIQITVKYLDPSQNLLRQVTIVESLAQ